jgi:steroid delta-isomerase-like uncharacterized protein
MSDADTRSLIERYFDALNAGNYDAALACLSDDVIHDVNQGGREIGKDKLRWFLGERARHFREEFADIALMIGEGGGRAAAEVTIRGTYLATAPDMPEASGQSYSIPAGIFFEVDDGLISRVTTYFNLPALKAALSRG